MPRLDAESVQGRASLACSAGGGAALAVEVLAEALQQHLGEEVVALLVHVREDAGERRRVQALERAARRWAPGRCRACP